MTTTKTKDMPPNYEQVCEVLGLMPQTELTRLAPGYDTVMKEQKRKTRKRSAKMVAKILGTTISNVKKALALGPQPKQATVQRIQWGHHGVYKYLPLTQQSRQWLVSPYTLRQQAGMSLDARVH
jgi:hypothetical protein